VSQPEKIAATHFSVLDERSRATVERLIDLILDVLPDAQLGQLTFTRKRDWHQWICAITSTRGVMEGGGRYSRTLAFRSREQIDPDALAPILIEAAARQMEM